MIRRIRSHARHAILGGDRLSGPLETFLPLIDRAAPTLGRGGGVAAQALLP